MLPAGLRLLLRLRARGFVRKTWRALRKPRTAIPLILVYGNMVFVFGMISAGRFIASGKESAFDFVTAELIAVVLSLLFILVMISPLFEFPLVFQSAEIQFLYPAPVRRLSLTLYKLASYAPIVLFTGLIGATILEGGRWQWFLAIPGTLTYCTFVLFSIVAIGMLARLPRVKYFVLGAMAVGAIAAAIELVPILRNSPNISDASQSFDVLRATYTFKILAAAGLPFAHVIADAFSTQWLANLGFILALTAAMFTAVLRLDVNFYEVGLRATVRREARLERWRRGKISRGAWKGSRRIRLPILPRLGGAGPTLHRHALSALRDRSALWLFVVLVTIPAVAGIYFRVTEDEALGEIRRMAVGITVYIAFIMTNLLRFDFGSDYSVLDYLKVLPINPFALAAGTIAIPATFALGIQLVPPAVFSLAGGVPVISLTWVLFLVPCNVMWFALDNAFYLRAPTPMVRGLHGNPTAMSQQFLASLGIGITLALTGGCAAGIYYLARIVSGSVLIAQLAASAFLWPCAAGAVFLTGRAFRDMDLGRDRI